MKNTNKKAGGEVGIAIIVMAVLLLLGGIFLDDTDSKILSFDKKGTIIKPQNNSYEESYLFYLNETELGRQKKVTESFPNIEVGSKIEQNIIFNGNNFFLKASPLTKNRYSFNVNLNKPQNTNSLLLYFDSVRTSGKQDLIVKVDNQTFYQNKANPNEIPITINKAFLDSNQVFTLELEKPRLYQIFNWNRLEVKNLKIIEIKQDRDNNIKTFNFQVSKEFLERVELNIVIDCDGQRGDKPIKVSINGYIITDFNPQCTSQINTITREIPKNIINADKNEIKFETNGYYKLSYSINKIYYNDIDVYKFTINSFNDIIDVVMYGNFDKEVIDIRLNQQTISLRRDEIKSIIPYLRFGTNEIRFLTKPVEIKNFVIEKNEFIY